MKVLGRQIYRFDEIEVDLSRGCVRRGGDELEVRQKSLQLLLYLLEQRHRLVTKEELIEHIYPRCHVKSSWRSPTEPIILARTVFINEPTVARKRAATTTHDTN